MNALISIIVPVYERFNMLPRVIESIVHQTYRPLDIIVVDDGNPEPPIIRFEKDSPSLSLRILTIPHGGAPKARNAGFRASRGSLIIFWDADVIAKPSLLARLMDALEKNPNASYAYSDFLFGRKKMIAGPFDSKKLQEKNYITTTSLLRREDFHGFDESLKRFQDWDLWLTLLEKGKHGVSVPETLFRVKPSGTMSSWLPKVCYRAPWKYIPGIRKKVTAYEKARQVIFSKHSL